MNLNIPSSVGIVPVTYQGLTMSAQYLKSLSPHMSISLMTSLSSHRSSFRASPFLRPGQSAERCLVFRALSSALSMLCQLQYLAPTRERKLLWQLFFFFFHGQPSFHCSHLFSHFNPRTIASHLGNWSKHYPGGSATPINFYTIYSQAIKDMTHAVFSYASLWCTFGLDVSLPTKSLTVALP